jgi:hypothetical protein
MRGRRGINGRTTYSYIGKTPETVYPPYEKFETTGKIFYFSSVIIVLIHGKEHYETL